MQKKLFILEVLSLDLLWDQRIYMIFYVNNPTTIARNPKVTAINSLIEVSQYEEIHVRF